MVAKTSILKELETIYEKSGNQLYVLYGRTDSEKEQLLKAFLSNKKYFYYRSRQASEQEQRNQMETEIRQKFSANITKHSYDEFFNRIKSTDPQLGVKGETCFLEKDFTVSVWDAIVLNAKVTHSIPWLFIISVIILFGLIIGLIRWLLKIRNRREGLEK